ncbi:hypothetical protein SAMN05216223_12382 [Actinacidiphila yanglinensis]|uniref:Uncharacterized protein n=2 Tax=Actinacidiphila yanglinensis TaxID=310779 RepID=A0A1H6E1R2_9ACTN|nr:hypothetical protein SAMN05216223_12382 [Actinacidiphila yanglinensis]
MFTCVDCRSEKGTVLLFDPHRTRDSLSRGWLVEADSLAAWLESWLAGRGHHTDQAVDVARSVTQWTEASSRLYPDTTPSALSAPDAEPQV